MTPSHLLNELTRRGVRLAPDGDELQVNAPAGVLTSEQEATVMHYKPELLALLRDQAPGITLHDLPLDWKIEWLERAAIREFDGGQARGHAEAEALLEVVERMRAASVENVGTHSPGQVAR